MNFDVFFCWLYQISLVYQFKVSWLFQHKIYHYTWNKVEHGRWDKIMTTTRVYEGEFDQEHLSSITISGLKDTSLAR